MHRCRLGPFRSKLCMRVDLGEGEMPIHKAQPAAELFADLFDHAVGRATMGTLEVTVLDQSNRRVNQAADVIAIVTDGQSQSRLHDSPPRGASPTTRGPSVCRR